ncbi:MAG: hypothetical protein ABEK17_00625 [Candidatus Aenigmatarchaeota archaeon]
MAKLRVEDSSDIELDITVENIPNPHKIYGEVKTILEDRIKMDDVNEENYEHTKGADKEEVKVELEATKSLDKFSKIVIEVTTETELKPVHKEDIEYVGKIEIEAEGKVVTEYPQESAIQKSILWDAFRSFYEKTLYGDIKDNYKDMRDKYMRTLRDEVKSFLDLLPQIR